MGVNSEFSWDYIQLWIKTHMVLYSDHLLQQDEMKHYVSRIRNWG